MHSLACSIHPGATPLLSRRPPRVRGSAHARRKGRGHAAPRPAPPRPLHLGPPRATPPRAPPAAAGPRRAGALTSDAPGTFPAASAQRGGGARRGARMRHSASRSPDRAGAGASPPARAPPAPTVSGGHVRHHRAGVRGAGCPESLAAAVLGESRARTASAVLLRGPGLAPADALPPPPTRAQDGSGGAGRVRAAPAPAGARALLKKDSGPRGRGVPEARAAFVLGGGSTAARGGGRGRVPGPGPCVGLGRPGG